MVRCVYLMAKKNGGRKEQALLLIYQVWRQIFRAIFPPSIAVATEFLFLLLFFPQVQVQMRLSLPPLFFFWHYTCHKLSRKMLFRLGNYSQGKKKKSAKWPWRLIREIQWQSFPGGIWTEGTDQKFTPQNSKREAAFFFQCLLTAPSFR